MNDREPSEGAKQLQATHGNSLPEAATSPPQCRIPVYETPPAFRMKPFSERELEELAESQRILEKRATRTPEELKIANDVWFDTKPGEATP